MFAFIDIRGRRHGWAAAARRGIHGCGVYKRAVSVRAAIFIGASRSQAGRGRLRRFVQTSKMCPTHIDISQTFLQTLLRGGLQDVSRIIFFF